MRISALPLLTAVALGACSEATDLPPTGPTNDAPKLGVERDGASAVRTFDITIENLTSGQPFSPGVVVSHARGTSVFRLGGRASMGVQSIAEDGDPTTAAGMLPGVSGVGDVVATAAPVFQSGGPGPNTLTVQLTATNATKYLSVVLMLICTNDGFVGLDGVKLPGGYETVTYYAGAYDGGTERNDERSTSIVDPCFAIGPVAGPADGNVRNRTQEPIRVHRGVEGGSDLDVEAHGWTDPVARITVTRIG